MKEEAPELMQKYQVQNKTKILAHHYKPDGNGNGVFFMLSNQSGA